MIRYAKRFTGGKKWVKFETILQYFDGEKWVDVNSPENAVWETPEDEFKFQRARDYEYGHSSR